MPDEVAQIIFADFMTRGLTDTRKHRSFRLLLEEKVARSAG